MGYKATAALLIAAVVLTDAAFTVLGMLFHYPGVPKEAVEEILAKFCASQNTVMFWFVLLALSAAFLTPVAIGVGRLSGHRAIRAAVSVGIAATFAAAGAVTFSVLSGVLLNVLLPARAPKATLDGNPDGARLKDNA